MEQSNKQKISSKVLKAEANDFHKILIIEELSPRYSRPAYDENWNKLRDENGNTYQNQYTAILGQIKTLDGRLINESLFWKPKQWTKTDPEDWTKELPCTKKEWVQAKFDYMIFKWGALKKAGYL